jgi:hypothetical protein
MITVGDFNTLLDIKASPRTKDHGNKIKVALKEIVNCWTNKI